MSDERRDVERQLMVDSQKPADVEGQDQNAVAAAPTIQPLARIFEMNIDCFDELFGWLSLKELLMLRQTCKRLKLLADYYIRAFYPAFKLGYGKIRICNENIDQFNHLDPNLAKLIKKITIDDEMILRPRQIHGLKEILSQVEVLEMDFGQIKGEFYEEVLQFCPNLKHLKVWRVFEDIIMGSGNEWLLRSYPQLEHVHFYDTQKCDSGGADEIPELTSFFELNPNIHTFSTTFNFLLKNRHCFMGSNIKFDVLNIDGFCTEINMEEVCDFANTLHEFGIYTRLHVSAQLLSYAEDWNAITTLSAMESLYVGAITTPIILSPPMSSLKVLGIDNNYGLKNSESLACDLMDIERFYLNRMDEKIAFTADVMSFVRYSAKVKEIVISEIKSLNGATNFGTSIIDLEALNKERGQLDGACKQTLYVPENIFLATKWAGMPTKCELIKLKPRLSCKWLHSCF